MTDQEQVAEAIKSLPLRLRRVFVMAHVQRKPLEEIEETLHLSEKRINRRLTKALALCRARLPDLEPPPGR